MFHDKSEAVTNREIMARLDQIDEQLDVVHSMLRLIYLDAATAHDSGYYETLSIIDGTMPRERQIEEYVRLLDAVGQLAERIAKREGDGPLSY